jgi:predicted choloylglycine hydrolase
MTDRNGVLRRIHQVPHTYAVVNFMNEHQLAIAEITFDGRLELRNTDGLFHYMHLMRFVLQRAKTAREAIQVITSLVGTDIAQQENLFPLPIRKKPGYWK